MITQQIINTPCSFNYLLQYFYKQEWAKKKNEKNEIKNEIYQPSDCEFSA